MYEYLEKQGFEFILDEDYNRDLTAYIKNGQMYYGGKLYKIGAADPSLKGYFIKEITT